MTDGVREDHLDALVDAADEGVACDGLRVERRPDGYAFEVSGDAGDDDSSDAGDSSDGAAGLSESALRDALAAHPRYVSNWFYWARAVGMASESRRAFLRWIERADERGVAERYDALADGVAREWGELRVTARLDDDGERRYDLRHAADADADTDALDACEDPRALRDLTTLDERGRYRPLKTAPSLRSGWVRPALDGRDLVEAVEVVYPATVANWHRERTGALDVTHWEESAARQTGIYDVVEDLPDEAVAWVAEACCVDSQCLKRREWDRCADDPLDVDRGDGAFPCREPCSLVIAAARKWALLEREDSRTYEFDLTPSEKAQVEAIVDAVADGRADEIREADVSEGANRYRARYLRAKRFDDEGTLPEAATGRDDPDGSGGPTDGASADGD